VSIARNAGADSFCDTQSATVTMIIIGARRMRQWSLEAARRHRALGGALQGGVAMGWRAGDGRESKKTRAAH
jgi:hypothetical protein